jgi:ATP-dependent Lhr-like helicase
VRDYLEQHGASFFDEMVDGTRLLGTELEEALAELVALGLIVSDSFAGLRALLVPMDRRKSLSGEKRRGRTAAFGIRDAGRWSLVRDQSAAADAVTEHVARTLLRRYGVVFWRLLAREAAWLPPWRDILRVLRRLEARGEIRGGRFVAGISGEQYALPEAVTALRDIRRRAPDGSLVAISAADPLNLAGIIVPGPKVAALSGNRLLYRDGVLIATLVADEVNWVGEIDPATASRAKSALIVRSPISPQLMYLR